MYRYTGKKDVIIPGFGLITVGKEVENPPSDLIRTGLFKKVKNEVKKTEEKTEKQSNIGMEEVPKEVKKTDKGVKNG